MTLMPTVADIAALLEQFAPNDLAEDWDNVGLLVGDRHGEVGRLMTCLTITPASAAEAIECKADLIVAHHPLPFRPLRRLTTDTTEGRLLLDLIGVGVAIYSPHTAFDSAASGVNERLAAGLDLGDIAPIVAYENVACAEPSTALGTGRWGRVDRPIPLQEIVDRVKRFLAIDRVRVVGTDAQPITRVGIACGSGGQLLDAARAVGCDCLVTGETNFHTCLEAQATRIALVLTGHFASERFAVESLAEHLAEQLPGVDVWASRHEQDPLRTV